MMDEMVGESLMSVDGIFLVNGTIPPLVQQAPFQSMYLLTVTTGNALDTTDTMDITFKLFAFINTSTGVIAMPVSYVILHKIGKISLLNHNDSYNFIYTYNGSYSYICTVLVKMKISKIPCRNIKDIMYTLSHHVVCHGHFILQ